MNLIKKQKQKNINGVDNWQNTLYNYLFMINRTKNWFFAVILLQGLSLAQEKGNVEAINCTFSGNGRDTIYEISCLVGKTIKFEVPGQIQKVIIDDTKNWLLAENESNVFLQPILVDSETSLSILAKYRGKTRVFSFRVIEQTRKLSGDGGSGFVRIILEEQ